jgi:hypothetical protein
VGHEGAAVSPAQPLTGIFLLASAVARGTDPANPSAPGGAGAAGGGNTTAAQGGNPTSAGGISAGGGSPGGISAGPMQLISRDAPAFASSGMAKNANDALPGPDLWGAFENRLDLIPHGDVHPNAEGQEFLRAEWSKIISGVEP